MIGLLRPFKEYGKVVNPQFAIVDELIHWKDYTVSLSNIFKFEELKHLFLENDKSQSDMRRVMGYAISLSQTIIELQRKV